MHLTAVIAFQPQEWLTVSARFTFHYADVFMVGPQSEFNIQHTVS